MTDHREAGAPGKVVVDRGYLSTDGDGIVRTPPDSSEQATGYHMIRDAKIRNFRSFQEVTLSGFRRVNLIVGDNGSGKTTLLEALFTALTQSAETGPRLRAWRGLETGVASQLEIYEGIYTSLFFKFDKSKTIEISLVGSEVDTRSVKIFFESGENQKALPLVPNTNFVSTYSPITFEYTDVNGKVERSTAQIQANGIFTPPVTARSVDGSFLAARAPFLLSENARWYSELSQKNKEKKFLKALQAQFDVESLSVEIDLGVPTMFLKTKWHDRKVPLNLISDGMSKIFTILLYIAHAERTATFIDELENGLHFSRHEKLWPQILSFANEFESQVFASTHSFEFIKAAVPTIKKHPNDFSLIRTYQKNGIGHATILQGKEALSLIESGLEVRG